MVYLCCPSFGLQHNVIDYFILCRGKPGKEKSNRLFTEKAFYLGQEKFEYAYYND